MKIQFSPNNNIIRLCMLEMSMEENWRFMWTTFIW